MPLVAGKSPEQLRELLDLKAYRKGHRGALLAESSPLCCCCSSSCCRVMYE